MSDFTNDEIFDRIMDFIPGISPEKQHELREALSAREQRTIWLTKVASINSYILINKLGDIKAVNSRSEIIFKHGVADLTEKQIELLHFFDIYVEQRERSLCLENNARPALKQKFILYPENHNGRIIFNLSIGQRVVQFTADKSVAKIIAEIRALTNDPEILGRVDEYLHFAEMNEVHQALGDLEANNNVVAIALLNILDEGEKRHRLRRQ